MLKVGALLVIIGISAYVLPLIGFQNRLIALCPPASQPYVGGAAIAVGLVLCVLGRKGKKKEEEKK